MHELLFILIALLESTVHCNKERNPTAPYLNFSLTNENSKVDFDHTRARDLLRAIVNFGPRISGSQNEKSASLYILKQLWNIKQHSKSHHNMEVQVQRASGLFSTDFGDGMTVYYRGITNLVAKIGPANTPSLLLSCHYDTVSGTTGATSSGFHCAIIIEVLFVISQYESSLENSIVFLFCGASEYAHLSAHGFVTKHPWNKNITAFVNLDGFGSGGRLMAIEAGPDNTWMIEGFAYSVSSPLSSIIIQEMINSDSFWMHTDYRMFCDIGRWPGLDLSYVRNSYIHRTKYDNESNIPLDKFKTAGENMLVLINKLLKSPYLLYPAPFKNSKIVYFDVLGWFLVSYSSQLGTVMYEIICLLTLLEMAIKVKLERVQGTSLGDHVIDIVFGFFLISFGTLLAVGWNAGLGAILEIAGHSMSWYTKTYWILGLYVCPAVVCLLIIHWIAAYVRRKRDRQDWLAEDKLYDSVRVFWIIVTCALSRCNYQAAYVCITWVLFPTIVRSLLGRLLIDFSAIRESRGNTKLLVLFHFLMQIIPLIVTIYTCWMIYFLLIPNLGRAGNATHPDIIIGITTALLTFSCISYWLSFLQISHPVHNYLPWLVGSLASINVITLLLVITTNIGFPYSGDVIRGPTPQIYFIVNVERIFRNLKSEVKKQDSGHWLIPNDAVGIEPLLNAVPELKKAKRISCEEELMCGMPFHLPFVSRFKRSYYLKNEEKYSIKREKVFKLVSVHAISENVYRMTFIIKGSNHMNVALSPRENVMLQRWSLHKKPVKILEKLKWKGRPVYFIYYTYGKFLGDWEFWIDLWIPKEYINSNHTILDVAFICHYLEYNDSIPRVGKLRINSDFINRLPNWIHPTIWWASYEKLEFKCDIEM